MFSFDDNNIDNFQQKVDPSLVIDLEEILS